MLGTILLSAEGSSRRGPSSSTAWPGISGSAACQRCTPRRVSVSSTPAPSSATTRSNTFACRVEVLSGHSARRLGPRTPCCFCTRGQASCTSVLRSRTPSSPSSPSNLRWSRHRTLPPPRSSPPPYTAWKALTSSRWCSLPHALLELRDEGVRSSSTRRSQRGASLRCIDVAHFDKRDGVVLVKPKESGDIDGVR
jgi:hypothetical protein